MSSQANPDRSETGHGDGEVTRGTLSKDDVFYLLQNARRRAVLRYLLGYDQDRFLMRDVAEKIAAWENDTTVQQLAPAERQRVYTALYQFHLPKLDDHGIIDYDQEEGHLEVQPLAHVLDPYLADGLDAPDANVVGSRSSRGARADSGLEKVLGLFR